MICESCNKTIFCHAKNICPKCGGEVVAKPKKKMGRPVTLSPEQRAKNRAKSGNEWVKNNAEHRRKWACEHARKKRGVVLGRFVIEHNGLFKRCVSGQRWDAFSIAKIYMSKGYADMAVSRMGKGVVLARMETEKETLKGKNATQKGMRK